MVRTINGLKNQRNILNKYAANSILTQNRRMIPCYEAIEKNLISRLLQAGYIIKIFNLHISFYL